MKGWILSLDFFRYPIWSIVCRLRRLELYFAEDRGWLAKPPPSSALHPRTLPYGMGWKTARWPAFDGSWLAVFRSLGYKNTLNAIRKIRSFWSFGSFTGWVHAFRTLVLCWFFRAVTSRSHGTGVPEVRTTSNRSHIYDLVSAKCVE